MSRLSVQPREWRLLLARSARIGLLLSCLVLVQAAQGAGPVAKAISIRALSDVLPAEPEGPIPACSDRAVWGNKELQSRLRRITKAVDGKFEVVVPPWSDAAYLEFSKTGARPDGEAMLKARQAQLIPLVLAECVEYKGRYLEAISKVLDALVSQRTWVYPAHDQRLETFRGERYFVDLNSADVADQVAQALHLLRGKLAAQLDAKARQALERRIFAPMRQSIGGKAVKGHEWLQLKTNWTPVCLEGVMSAVLAVLPDRAERAQFILASTSYLDDYLDGFSPDGYSGEGLAYWNYGFGRYLELREELVRTTNGIVDLLANPRAHQVAMFGARIAMWPGNAALFGDAAVGTRPDHNATVYAMQAFNWKNAAYAAYESPLPLILLIFGRATPYAGAARQELLDPLRHYFPDAGVLVARPGPISSSQLAVTVKSGGNVNHSHNDIGSYVIGMGDDQPMGDPGGVLSYNRDSFGARRYESKVFNSYGHPVPVVAGRLQTEATKITPPSPTVSFTETADEFVVDLARAYATPQLKSLTRSMTYSRSGNGAVRVTDSFEFDSPQTFETAITTRGEVRHLGDGVIELRQGKGVLLARVQASDEVEFKDDEVKEGGISFRRVGLALRHPSPKGSISIEYSPPPVRP